jgi:hypothetical protein
MNLELQRELSPKYLRYSDVRYQMEKNIPIVFYGERLRRNVGLTN